MDSFKEIWGDWRDFLVVGFTEAIEKACEKERNELVVINLMYFKSSQKFWLKTTIETNRNSMKSNEISPVHLDKEKVSKIIWKQTIYSLNYEGIPALNLIIGISSKAVCFEIYL